MPDDAPRLLRARDRVFELGPKTHVMAILNLTDNSFSGDGTGADIEAALRRAVAARAEGAEIVDVGGESARADVPVRDAREEAEVVSEVVRRIAGEVDIAISVDTYKRPVAEAAMQAGACMINDIGGFMYDTGTAEIAAQYGAALVINYTFERPKVRPVLPPRYDDLVAAHIAFFRQRIEMARNAGVRSDALLLDPGIAFGKSHDEDLEMLRRLPELAALGLPLLVSASRKHFIGSVLPLAPGERDLATAAVTALSIAYGADFVRVHDVRSNVTAASLADAIVRGRLGDFTASAASWPWSQTAQPIEGTTIEGVGE